VESSDRVEEGRDDERREGPNAWKAGYAESSGRYAIGPDGRAIVNMDLVGTRRNAR